MYKSSLYTNHLWALDRREPRRYVTFLAATKFLDACGYLHAANGAKCIKYIQIVCDLDSTPGHPILLTACWQTNWNQHIQNHWLLQILNFLELSRLLVLSCFVLPVSSQSLLTRLSEARRTNEPWAGQLYTRISYFDVQQFSNKTYQTHVNSRSHQRILLTFANSWLPCWVLEAWRVGVWRSAQTDLMLTLVATCTDARHFSLALG